MNRQTNHNRKQVFRRSRANPGGNGGKHLPRKHGEHRTIFAAREIIPESGIYEVIHEHGHRASHESVLVKGDAFPDCETCHAQVRFRVVRVAPYIFDDQDFGDE
jgi:hypothetical protein